MKKKAYITHPTFKGYCGHKFTQMLQAYTIAKLFDLEFAYTPNIFLSGYRLDGHFTELKDLNPKMETILSLGDHKRSYNELKEEYGNIDRDVLICMGRNKWPGCYPTDTLRWYKEGIIEKEYFTESVKEFTDIYFKKKPIKKTNDLSVAIHINRGKDWDSDRHRYEKDSRWPRYFFPMSYYDNIINHIKDVFDDKAIEFKIYTETLHSEEIVSYFSNKKDIEVCTGPDRLPTRDIYSFDQAFQIEYCKMIPGLIDKAPDDGGPRFYSKMLNHHRAMAANMTNTLLWLNEINNITNKFICSDIFVSCNSSYSIAANYFRYNKPTIYYHNNHFDRVVGGGDKGHCDGMLGFIDTNLEGNFNKDYLNQLIRGK